MKDYPWSAPQLRKLEKPVGAGEGLSGSISGCELAVCGSEPTPPAVRAGEAGVLGRRRGLLRAGLQS